MTRYDGIRPVRIEVGNNEVERLWQLTPLENAGLAVDSTLRTMKITTGLMPYVFNTIAGLLTMNWKTTVTGIVGALAYLVKIVFSIDLPTEAISVTCLFLIGLFAKEWHFNIGKTQE